jgi:Zn-dependent protease
VTSPNTPSSQKRGISRLFLTFVAITAAAGWAVWTGFGPSPGLAVFLAVTFGWLVTLCLHEFAHEGSAALMMHKIPGQPRLTGRYLSPLKYTHVALSIVLPVLFVIMGGIGLPGGAVFIERHRIRGRWKHSLISAAGPLTNVAFAIVLTAPFWLGVDGVPEVFRCALAFLAMLQVTAAILNFLPVPGLDGYGVIEPWLSYRVRRQVEPYAPFGLIAVFGVLWIPEVNTVFFDAIDAVMRALGVSEWETFWGQEFFRFWKGEPQLS